jgi:phi LC3 family holin
MVNWKVRVRNKSFWVTLVPAVALFAQAVAACFDVRIDLGEQTDKIMAVINTLFVVLGVIGVVNDPTTFGLNDSPRAMTYDEPYQYDVNSDGRVDENDVAELLERMRERDLSVL